MYRAILDFGFPPENLAEKDFVSKDLIFQMGFPPVRIDVLTAVDALEFSDCFARKEKKNIDGIEVTFLNIEDLKKKQKSSR
jgi:hypothetical protein